MKKEFIPSEEQAKVLDAIRFSTGNIVVNAMAGSGKTTTLEEALKVIPANDKVLFVAFNKTIVNKLKKELGPDNRHRRIATYHSMGYRVLRNFLNADCNLKINELKYKSYIFKEAMKLSNGRYSEMSKFNRQRYVNNITDLVDYARYNLMQNKKEIKSLCDKYCINTIDNEVNAAVKVLEWGQTCLDEFDYTDLIWLPIELNIDFGYFKYDWVFIDEAQDSSPCQQALFKKCLKSNGRCVMVGDRDQCINGWCGSDTMAFENLLKMPNTKELGLTVSFRCPKRVIKLAQDIVPDIKALPNAIDGEIYYNVDTDRIKPGDAILCRTTEPLVRLHMKFLEEGKNSFIVGRTYGSAIISQIDCCGKEYIGRSLDQIGIVSELYHGLWETVLRLAAEKGVDCETICTYQSIINTVDLINAVKILSRGIETKKELIDRINETFITGLTEYNTEDNRLLNTKTNIILSTIHKAKGLEFDNVYLACPSLLPSPMARTNEEKREEENLEYVCVTRARKTFSTIDESIVPPTTTWNKTLGAFEELSAVKDKIIEMYGPFQNYEASGVINEDSVIADAPVNVDKIIKPVVNKKKIKFKNLLK